MQKNVITFLCSLLASEILNSIDMRITCFKVFSELQGPFCSLFIKLSRQFASNVNIVVWLIIFHLMTLAETRDAQVVTHSFLTHSRWRVNSAFIRRLSSLAPSKLLHTHILDHVQSKGPHSRSSFLTVPHSCRKISRAASDWCQVCTWRMSNQVPQRWQAFHAVSCLEDEIS